MTNLTIWKFRWPPTMPGTHEFAIPKGYEILHVDEHFGCLCFWARIDVQAPMIAVKFRVCPTGAPCPPDKYIGTCKINDNAMILHLFEMAQ